MKNVVLGYLPNGLRLELIVGSDPGDADIAVCSSDELGNRGPLNQEVLRAVGFDVEQLPSVFRPPATLIRTSRMPVLVVQTKLNNRTVPRLVQSSLQEGLARLRDVGPRGRVWLPLIGTGAGGIPLLESAEVLVEVLSSWERGTTAVVQLAAPDEKVAQELVERWRGRWPLEPPASEKSPAPEPLVLALGPEDAELHVSRALRAARILSYGNPVTALHVLVAIVSLAETARSEAFSQLRSLIQLEPDTHVGGFSVPETGEPVDPLTLGEELRRWLAWAQARSGPGKRLRLWGRDLVTAALLCQDEELATRLKDTSTPLEDVRDRWFEYVTREQDSQEHMDWKAWWEAAGVPLPGPRRAGYSTETDEGEDKLGVEAEAAAFARLILDEQVTPPLSIGLLGDWGSGKSFFIEQIKDQVAKLRGRPGLYEHVVEIEFNAWHASDANLWASLVTSIFDEIWQKVAVEGTKADPAVARQKLLQELEQAGGAVHEAEGQVALARAALEEAEKDLEKRRDELAWSRYVKSVTVEGLQEIARRAGWQEPLQLINDVEGARRRLTQSGERLRLMVTSMVERPGMTVALPLVVVGGVVALALWGLQQVELQPALARLTRLIAALAGGLAALVTPLKAASAKVEKLVESLGKIEDDYDQALEEARKDPKTAGTASRVATARRELESAEATVIAARTHLAELQNQLAALDPGRRLGAFLQERVQSTQYRSQQGIISLVHKDFLQLSKRMKDWRQERARLQAANTPPASSDIKPFDRIIIYVDDLDRCRPDHVVHMLEAVHLLLALDLFVVVVAVDSRWLMRALQVHYKDLLTALDGDGDDEDLRSSTAQNYLEKIFQVTYALAPMDPLKFKGYVDYLAGSEAAPVTPAAPEGSGTPEPGATQPRDERAATATPPPGPAGTPGARPSGAAAAAGTEPGVTQRQPPEGPPPRTQARLPPLYAVRISAEERRFLYELGPLLPTPRIAKRLVNVYRLIKAAKSAEQLAKYEQEGRYRSCLLMLAILLGRPAISAELFRSLHERRPPFDKGEEKMVDAVRRRAPQEPPSASDTEGAQWASLLRELERLGGTFSVGACAREAYEVARYSLVTGRDWHTWSQEASGAESAALAQQRSAK
ncbi:MAG: hypothetical protein JXB05_21025 [Myxococcaceae bacterium]|nr:hypothetical protein [Myxococcaceae bacterium]